MLLRTLGQSAKGSRLTRCALALHVRHLHSPILHGRIPPLSLPLSQLGLRLAMPLRDQARSAQGVIAKD
jgi:hypothetical protein